MLRDRFVACPKSLEQPIASRLCVGHRLLGREGLRGDNEKCFCWIQALDGFGKVRSVDVRNKDEASRPIAVAFKGLIGHHRTEI